MMMTERRKGGISYSSFSTIPDSFVPLSFPSPRQRALPQPTPIYPGFSSQPLTLFSFVVFFSLYHFFSPFSSSLILILSTSRRPPKFSNFWFRSGFVVLRCTNWWDFLKKHSKLRNFPNFFKILCCKTRKYSISKFCNFFNFSKFLKFIIFPIFQNRCKTQIFSISPIFNISKNQTIHAGAQKFWNFSHFRRRTSLLQAHAEHDFLVIFGNF